MTIKLERRWPRWWEIVRGVAIGFAVYLLLMIASLARPPWRSTRSGCQQNLRLIGLALLNYRDTNGRLPEPVRIDPGSREAATWRVYLGPFLQPSLDEVDYRYDEAWNGPHNLMLLKSRPAIYVCPSSRPPSDVATDYVMFVGDASEPAAPQGASHTPLVAEARRLCIPWTEPRDLSAAEFRNLPHVQQMIGGAHPNGANLLMADGHVDFIDQQVAPEVMRDLLGEGGAP